jgi:hypothetical protein
MTHHGELPSIEAYPFQGLDLPYEGYETDADSRRSNLVKYGPITAVIIRRSLA